jgi:hypothetical protein
MPELWTDEFSQARDWLRRTQRLTQDQMLIPLRGGPSVARRSRTRDALLGGCPCGRVSRLGERRLARAEIVLAG